MVRPIGLDQLNYLHSVGPNLTHNPNDLLKLHLCAHCEQRSRLEHLYTRLQDLPARVLMQAAPDACTTMEANSTTPWPVPQHFLNEWEQIMVAKFDTRLKQSRF